MDITLIGRGLFAIGVVFWHTLGWDLAGFDALNIPGRVFVWLFFGMSGYVIAYGFAENRHQIDAYGLTRYAVRRFARIFPLFWLLSIVSIGAFTFREQPVPLHGVEALAEFFALKWHHSYALNGVFWTLGIELQFYLIAPFLAYLLIRYPNYSLWIVGFFWLILWFALGRTNDNRTVFHAMLLFLPGVGVAFARKEEWFQSLIQRESTPYVAAAVFLASLSLTAYVYHNDLSWFWRRFGVTSTSIAIVSLLVLHCWIERQAINSLLIVKLFEWLGTVSYGVYAWHGVLILHVIELRNQFLLTTLTSIALAACSFYAIEKPCIRWSKRYRAVDLPSQSAI